MSLVLCAPFTGRVVPLADVPDEVFASGMLGPGLALVPDDDARVLDVVSPCSGRAVALHPHAVALEVRAGAALRAAVVRDDGAVPGGGVLDRDPAPSGVLLHLGIDTVGLRGAGFAPVAGVQVGSEVVVGQALTSWDLRVARDAGLAVVSPVVVLQRAPEDVEALVAPGARVERGEPMARVPR